MRLSPRRAILVALLAVVLPVAALAGSKTRPRVQDLRASLADERLEVSFLLVDGLSDDAVERIDSGLAVTQRHRIELVSRRAVPLVGARVLSRAVVENTVLYDSLTRRYTLTREIRFSGRGATGREPETSQRTTESRAEVEAWMGRHDAVRLGLPARLPPSQKLRVRVESSLDRRYVLWMFPSRVTASAETKLAG